MRAQRERQAIDRSIELLQAAEKAGTQSREAVEALLFAAQALEHPDRGPGQARERSAAAVAGRSDLDRALGHARGRADQAREVGQLQRHHRSVRDHPRRPRVAMSGERAKPGRIGARCDHGSHQRSAKIRLSRRPITTQSDAAAASIDYNAFLRLLIAQMKNQDPTKPMDLAQFMAQLASFSNVEQGIKMNQKLDSHDDIDWRCPRSTGSWAAPSSRPTAASPARSWHCTWSRAVRSPCWKTGARFRSGPALRSVRS